MKAKETTNPSDITLLALIAEDLRTHGSDPLSQGFWAIANHRIWIALLQRTPACSLSIVGIGFRVSTRIVEWFTGITILYDTRIGRRLRIWHHGGIIINAERVGNDVVIRQNTTIGNAGDVGRPTIEDMVDIGCGAAILGAVSIGSRVRIGANAVVLQSIPEGATAVGVPARIIVRSDSLQ